ncbi:filamentous hemagglutinin N-terminal domain-containing protein, partial [Serratia microhaemolytica]|uniref:two-partner secretion domain-containing protein n=1 Tax=Serratia microhaemolytica TaxID=2675110 RepID=UPI000FDEE222
MNKQYYRVIFSRQLQRCVVVSELAKRDGKVVGEGSALSAPAQTAVARLSAIAQALLWALGMTLLPSGALQAQIIADAQAPGTQQAQVLNTANGLPQVNIQTPSAAGVSHNKYRQFDVDQRGAILNNSYDPSKTQLGGWVNGNPNLIRGEAKIILNEVNSSNPSQLNGYLEVAGRKAQVVIANPAGISCDGCGFINANRVTLTTGLPQLDNGQLTGYQVNGGSLRFSGLGMDSQTADYTDLIARSVELNAGVWAQQLDITTGLNWVSADHSQINASQRDDGSAPRFALDLSALGGMYAGKIRLIGTEQGVGVHNAGEIGASAGEIQITADGKLINSGKINSSGDLRISQRQGISNSGLLYSGNNNQIQTDGVLENQGTLAAARNTTLQAGELASSQSSVLAAGLNGDGSLGSAGQLQVSTRGKLQAQGKNLAAQQLRFQGEQLDLDASQSQAAEVELTARSGGIRTRGATLQTPGRLTINAAQQHVDNGDGKLYAGELTINAATLNNSGTLYAAGYGDLKISGALTNYGTLFAEQGLTLTSDSLTNSGALQTRGDLALTVAGDVDNSGSLYAEGALALQSGGNFTHSGSLSSGGNSLLRVGGDSRNQGALYSGGDLQWHNGGQLLNSGSIAALGALTIDTGDFVGQQGSLLAAGLNREGRLAAAQQLSLNSQQRIVSQGQQLASGALTLQAQSLDLRHSQTQANRVQLLAEQGDLLLTNAQVHSASDLQVEAAHNVNSDNAQLVAEQISLTAAALSNVGGQWLQTGVEDFQLTIDGLVDNRSGTLLSSGDLHLNAQQLRSDGQSLLAAGVQTDGQMRQRGDLSVETRQALQAQGQTLAAGQLTLRGQSLDLSGSQTYGQQISLTATEGDIITRQAEVSTPGLLSVVANGADQQLDNREGSLKAGEMVIDSARVDNHGGTISSAGDLNLTLQSDFIHQADTHWHVGGDFTLKTSGDILN